MLRFLHYSRPHTYLVKEREVRAELSGVGDGNLDVPVTLLRGLWWRHLDVAARRGVPRLDRVVAAGLVGPVPLAVIRVVITSVDGRLESVSE